MACSTGCRYTNTPNTWVKEVGTNMARLTHISKRTLERLREGPTPGSTHIWLAQVAGGLRALLPKDVSRGFLRLCTDECVKHRNVPDRELNDALDLAYGETPLAPAAGLSPVPTGRSRRRAVPEWPPPDPRLIQRVLESYTPAFDPAKDPGLGARDVLLHLFKPGELLCTGPSDRVALVRPLEDSLMDAEYQQFIVVNPMLARMGINKAGRESARCQSNVAVRRHIVAEFDNRETTKMMQAQLVTFLGSLAPLVLVVDSAGKSLHAWYRVDAMDIQFQAQFFAVACMTGADPSRWDICGWLRMPGGLRVVDGVPQARQRILFFNPQDCHAR